MNAPEKQPDPIDVEVGIRIRLRRKIVGMSQSILAEALGVTFQQVQKYEKGTNRVGASRLQAVASALKVPVSHFFNGSEVGAQALDADEAVMTNFLITSEGLALNKAFMSIADSKVRRQIVALIKALAHADQDTP